MFVFVMFIIDLSASGKLDEFSHVFLAVSAASLGSRLGDPLKHRVLWASVIFGELDLCILQIFVLQFMLDFRLSH